MQRNVLEYLDRTSELYGDKMAFDDGSKKITFRELKNKADAIGSRLIKLGKTKAPIAVYLPKGCDCISAFMGIVSSGNFYCPIDVTMPLERIHTILEVLQPIAILTADNLVKNMEALEYQGEIIELDDAENEKVDEERISEIRFRMLDIDPLYVLFTSGSTGVPKGVLISHRAVIDYIDWVTETFKIDDTDTFGNQAPFYFDNSILDIYCALKNGSSVYIIPKKKFLFPKDLITYLNECKINIIFWVPSVLCNIANLKGLEVVKPQFLRKILFCGEVMPNKQLNIWRKAVPDALYANLYGPTEITDVCTYYIVNREFNDDDSLPIGIPCKNTGVIVLNEADEPVQGDEAGELCVMGTCLALGYYNNPQKTKEVFVQNPLNNVYEEKIYRTGDIVKYNERGELLYLSRKDFQIKHMGHRIELGEIEVAFGGKEGIENCACIYDDEKSKIVMCYTGKEEKIIDLISYLKKKVPEYMIPNQFLHLKKFPYNVNGKIDRKALKKEYI